MIRFGVIGAGGISRKFIQDIKHASNATLVAIASRNIEKADAYKDEYDIPYAFGSYEELVKSDLIDAVYIATPHSHHLQQIKLALLNNKHVLCEKPITVNKKQLEEAIDLAKAKNLLLMEAMWSLFLPSNIKLKEYMKEHQDFSEMHLNFGYKLDSSYPKDGRLLNINLAGGTTLDLGVYPVSIMNYLTDKEIKSIQADAEFEYGIDMDMRVVVTFRDNSKAYLHASMLENLDWKSYITYDDKKVEVPAIHHASKYIIDGKEYETPFKGDGFTDQIESFSKTLLDGERENHIMTYDRNLKVMDMLDVIRKKIKMKYPFE